MHVKSFGYNKPYQRPTNNLITLNLISYKIYIRENINVIRRIWYDKRTQIDNGY